MKTMKRIIIAILTLVGVISTTALSAQSRNSYFMEGTYFRTELNPALAPHRGYIALPVLSGVGINLNTNYLSLDNFFYKNGSELVTAFHESVSLDQFPGSLPRTEKLSMNTNLTLLGVGFYARHTFWNFGVNLRVQSDMALSREFFEVVRTLENGDYDMSNTSMALNSYIESYVGFSRQILDNLTIGARLKFLSGLVNASTEVESINLSVGSDAVRGHLYSPFRASGPVFNPLLLLEVEDEETPTLDDALSTGDMDYMLGHVNNYGAAIDLGAQATFLNDRLRVSAAVTDLGFIRWSGATRVDGELLADLQFEGFNLDSGEVEQKPEAELRMLEPTGKNYTTRLNCSLNLGAEYNILKDRIGFGLLSHTEFCQTMSFTELTLSANFRPAKWFSATVSHTLCNRNKVGVPGVALNLSPAGFNFYVGADYLGFAMATYEGVKIPKSMKSFNLYMGIGFNLGAKKAVFKSKKKSSSEEVLEPAPEVSPVVLE